MATADVRRPDMHRADIPWLATPVAVMSPDTAAAIALERFTMDRSTTGRSITAALVTTLSTVVAPAMAFRLSAVWSIASWVVTVPIESDRRGLKSQRPPSRLEVRPLTALIIMRVSRRSANLGRGPLRMLSCNVSHFYLRCFAGRQQDVGPLIRV
jgi:hypothetical protein